MRFWVPDRFRSVEPRKDLFVSLKTSNGAEAMRVALVVQQGILASLNARLAGSQAEVGNDYYERLRDLALAHGFPYKPASELAAGPLEDILTRIESLSEAALKATDGVAVAAVLGAVYRPSLKLSDAADRIEQIRAYSNRMKNASQMYVWKQPIVRCFDRLRQAIGSDKEVLGITQEDAIAHRDVLLQEIRDRKMKTSSARKELGEIAKSIIRIQAAQGLLNGPQPYLGVSIDQDKFEEQEQKPEFSNGWIRDTLLKPGPMSGLNSEARDIILISLETGCRQSEIHDLPAHRIFLNAPIPYMMISHDEGQKEQKNNASVRPVPLMGVALAAMKRRAEHGFFPRYRGKRGYSAAANKYFRDAGLFPSQDHTIGGLRHSWEKRLKRAELENDDRGEMMGHSVGAARGREVYGDMMTVEERAQIVAQVVFDVPDPFAELGVMTVRRRPHAA